MIAAALGGKSAGAGRAGTAVGGDVIVEYRRPADELTALVRARIFPTSCQTPSTNSPITISVDPGIARAPM